AEPHAEPRRKATGVVRERPVRRASRTEWRVFQPIAPQRPAFLFGEVELSLGDTAAELDFEPRAASARGLGLRLGFGLGLGLGLGFGLGFRFRFFGRRLCFGLWRWLGLSRLAR